MSDINAALDIIDASDLQVDTSRPVYQGVSKAILKSQNSSTVDGDEGQTVLLNFNWELQNEVSVVGADRKAPPGTVVQQSFALKAPKTQRVEISKEELARALRAVNQLPGSKVAINRALIEGSVGKTALLDLSPRSAKNGEVYQNIKVKAVA